MKEKQPKGQARYLWPGLWAFSVALFTWLSLYNSHKAIVSTTGIKSHRPSVQWARNDFNDPDDSLSASYVVDPSNNGTAPQPVCLTQDCLVAVAQSIARSFPPRPRTSWCIPTAHRGQNSLIDQNNSQAWQGLLLVKVPKAASSTAAGLVLRMANRTGCAVQWEHREGHVYATRTKQSFLLGSVRQPAARSLSSVWFFLLTPLNITPTDNNVIRSLHTRRGGKTKGKGGFQYNYLSLEAVAPRSVWTPHAPTHVRDAPALHARLQRLLQSYDFMLVVERMDESLTALAHLTGLSLKDVLVTNSKVAGSWLFKRVGRDSGTCQRQLKEPTSAGVQAYIESDEWVAMNYADEILWRAANASLDRTIASIGHDTFAASLQEFRRLKEQVLQVCGSRLGFGCSDQGEPLADEQCYLRDFGCGYSCIDSVVDGNAVVVT